MKHFLLRNGNYLTLEDSNKELDKFYIVESGALILESREPFVEEVEDITEPFFSFRLQTRELQRGNFFGLMSPVLGFKRFESVWAVQDSKILSVSRNALIDFIQQQKEYARYILKELFERLRYYNAYISKKREETKGPERVFIIGKQLYEQNRLPQALYAFETLCRLYPQSDYAKKGWDYISWLNQKVVDQFYLGFQKNEPEQFTKNAMDFYRYAKDQIIFCEEEIGEELYLIKQGKVAIKKYTPERDITLDILGEGEIFGEMAVLGQNGNTDSGNSSNRRSATAVAFEETTLVGISREKIDKIFELDKYYIFVDRLIKTLLKRIWHTKLVLMAKSLSDPLDKIVFVLFAEISKEYGDRIDIIGSKLNEPFEFKFDIDGLLQSADITKFVPNDMELPDYFSLNDLMKKFMIRTSYGATLIKNRKIFSLKKDRLVCDDPEALYKAWKKIYRRVVLEE